MPNPLFDSLFGKHAANDATFLHLADGRTLSYRQFLHRAAQLAHALAHLGLKAGDRIAAQIEKSPQALALYAACAQSGLVFLPLNTGYTPTEVSYFVEDCTAAVLVCDPSRAAALGPVAARANSALATLGTDGSGTLGDQAARMSESFATVDRDQDDLAALLYTSGTTGRSKGAMLSQRNLLSNAQTLVDYWRFTAQDVLLHALPIFHTHGLFVATNITLIAGGRMIFLPKFDTDQVIDWLPQATAMMGVPTFYTRLLDSPRLTKDIVGNMRLFISGSAPLLAETHTTFAKRTGHRILERYGMTETNMNTSNPYDGDRRAGTVGLPLPGVEAKITDPETGVEVANGEIGVIEVRGPNVFQGYWQMPEKTAQELRTDGFFVTGDLARRDPDGYIQIIGRSKDMIISGGYNIYPKEIESVLDAQDSVLESAVIGVPHPDLGEAVFAVIVPKKGETPDPEQLIQSLGADLARFKLPKQIVCLDQLPRNTMGKVQKNILRDQFCESFSQP